jgi:4-aminobutyrate aminotransferase / (S)-3-amino-2-methylpropionate transaminase / 5-aminovalerate transaminase
MSTNASLHARRTAAVPQGVANATEIYVERAENALIWDVEGRRYVDFAGGIAVLNTGHLHPLVMERALEQAARFTHTCFQVVPYEAYVALAEKLNALAPGATPKKSIFFTTGAEALENAVKIARAATGRPGVIAFVGGYHGRTHYTLGLTGKIMPYKHGFGPFPADIYRAPFPNPMQGVSEEEALRHLDMLMRTDAEPSRIAAIVIEPVLGEGGYVPAPAGFLRGLRTAERQDRHRCFRGAGQKVDGACVRRQLRRGAGGPQTPPARSRCPRAGDARGLAARDDPAARRRLAAGIRPDQEATTCASRSSAPAPTTVASSSRPTPPTGTS